MKRIALAIVMSCILLATTACSGAPSGTTTSSTAPGTAGTSSTGSSEKKTLDVWFTSVDADTEQVIRDLAADFADEGVTVNVSFTQADPYRTKLKTVMGSGGAPDVFVNWGGGATEQFIQEDQLYDITDEVQDWKDEVFAASWNAETFGDNRIYGVPYNIHGSMMFYNKTMFANLGLEPPATYADLQDVAARLIE